MRKPQQTEPTGQTAKPSANVPDGHDAKGRFAAGNKLGQGNPHASQVSRLRSTMLNSVTQKDLKAVVTKLVSMAKEGDLRAIQLLFDRVFGRAVTTLEVGEERDLDGTSANILVIETDDWYGTPRRATD